MTQRFKMQSSSEEMPPSILILKQKENSFEHMSDAAGSQLKDF